MHYIAELARGPVKVMLPEGFVNAEGFMCHCKKQYRFFVPKGLSSGSVKEYRLRAKSLCRKEHPKHSQQLLVLVSP